MEPRTITSVDVDLCAFHTDPVGMEGRHAHTWNVRLVFDGKPFRDARLLRKALEVFLEPYQGNDLPWWSGEEIARTVLVLGTADPIGCIVTRPGYRAEVWREAPSSKQDVQPPFDDDYWHGFGTIGDRG